MGIAVDLMAAAPLERRLFLAEMNDRERTFALVAVNDEFGTPHAIYRDDPVGFCHDILGDHLWSRQRMIAMSVMKHKRTVVPACVGPGKTYLAGRLATWFVAVYPPGKGLVVSTAKRWRQVKSQLWPHIRTSARKAGLPGRILQTEWWMGEDQVAYGFAPNEYDESGTAGIHPPPGGALLIIVDEAGGIVPLLGNQLNGLLTGDSRILCIGNPPTDEESGWFEGVCQSPIWNEIPIPAFSTPNFTGEPVPDDVARQLIDAEFVRETAREFGEDSAYYIAKVLAQFPRVFARKVIPVGWAEDARDNENPQKSGWQRLGVDVASDGGDEMVVALADGNVISVLDVWANADSADQYINAGRVLEWILKAQGRQKQLGYNKNRVRVKMDGIGIGAGTADILINWGREGKHDADIVKVIVSETATEDSRFARRRDECWWTMREVIRDGSVKLKISPKELAQLTGPTWQTNNSGKIEVEQKKKMKARGVSSPDRADAINMTVYEPEFVGEAQSYADQLANAALSQLARRHE